MAAQSKDPFKKQIAGSHYRNFKIQPSKFINDNELLLFVVLPWLQRNKRFTFPSHMQ